MEYLNLNIEGLKLIKPLVFEDERGFFLEEYKKPEYEKIGIDVDFVQDNSSFSKRNVLRGLHFQEEPMQDKLVFVVEGEIFDVAVDLRKGSKTFGKWESIILSSKNHFQFFIPKGFAHGFCVLSESAHIFYKVSAPFNSKTEKSVRWDDPTLAIEWPITNPILSKRDREGVLL